MTLTARCDLGELLQEAASTCRSPAITFGFQIANGCLFRLAKRAIELNDEKLITELTNIGYIVKE